MSSAGSPRLVNQRVLVTGAGRGIGRAIALICSRHGAKVAIVSRTRSELEETASLATVAVDECKDATPPIPMALYVADVTNTSQVEETVKSICQQWNGIDILINNAGCSQKSKGPLETLSSSDLSAVLNLNVVAVHSVTSSVLRHAMLPAKHGKIVNISSRAGKVGLPNYSHYCASKFALEGLTASLAEEVRDLGIQCNTLSPGMVNTKSFPKPEGKQGVRSAESVEDALFALLEGGVSVTGCYVHADELDEFTSADLYVGYRYC